MDTTLCALVAMLLIVATNMEDVTASGERERHKMERKQKHAVNKAIVDATAKPPRSAQKREQGDDATNTNGYQDRNRKHTRDTAAAATAVIEPKFTTLQRGGTHYGQGSRSESGRTSDGENDNKVAGKEAKRPRPEKASAAPLHNAKNNAEGSKEKARQRNKPEKVSDASIENSTKYNLEGRGSRDKKRAPRFNPPPTFFPTSPTRSSSNTFMPTYHPTTFMPTAMPTFIDKLGQAYQGPLPKYVYVGTSGSSKWSGGKGRRDGYLVPYIAPPTYMPTTFMPTTYPPTIDPNATPSPNMLPTYQPTYQPTTSYPTFSPVWEGGWWGWQDWSGGRSVGRSSEWSDERFVVPGGPHTGDKAGRRGGRQGGSSKGGKSGGRPGWSTKGSKSSGQPGGSGKGGKLDGMRVSAKGGKPGVGARGSAKGGKSGWIGSWYDPTRQTLGHGYPANMGWWRGTFQDTMMQDGYAINESSTAANSDKENGGKGGKRGRLLNRVTDSLKV